MREKQAEIRRGIWGAYSQVKATVRAPFILVSVFVSEAIKRQLFVPDVPAFPTETPIPFRLKVTTISKPMKRDAIKKGELPFPAPPMHPKELDFWLNRVVWLRADKWTSTGTYPAVATLGNFGQRSDPELQADFKFESTDKVWIPLQNDPRDEMKQEGRWKQEVTLRSSFTLDQTPSFETDTLRVKVSISENVLVRRSGSNKQ